MVGQTEFAIEEFRKRIQAMSDEQLLRYGKAARSMADPQNSADKRTVHEVYRMQLRECRAEYRRRHPKENRADTDGKPNENASGNHPLQGGATIAD